LRWWPHKVVDHRQPEKTPIFTVDREFATVFPLPSAASSSAEHPAQPGAAVSAPSFGYFSWQDKKSTPARQVRKTAFPGAKRQIHLSSPYATVNRKKP